MKPNRSCSPLRIVYKSPHADTTPTMSEVIAFCERHNLTSMLNLLRHIGGMNQVREVLAVNVLKQLVADDADKRRELEEICSRVNPVEIRARLRAINKEREAKILAAQNEKRALIKEIEQLEAALRQKKATPAVAEEEHETQLFGDGDDQDTQNDHVDQATALLLLKNLKRK
jgi:hypothetical protein